MNDEEILASIKTDKKNFSILFDQYFVPVKKYIIRRVINYDVASDIAAETFLKVYLNIHKFQLRGSSIKAWIYRIATNETNLYFRHKKYAARNLNDLLDYNNHHAFSDQQKEKDEWEKEIRMHDDFRKAQQLLIQLPIRYAEVLSLRYFEKLSVKETAMILKKSEGTIKSLCARGLSKLRHQMQPDS